MSGSDGFDPLASLFDAPPPRSRKKGAEAEAPPEQEFDAPPPPSFRTEFTDPRISDVDLDADEFERGDPVTDDGLRDRITQEVEREAEAAEGGGLPPVPDEVLDAPPPPAPETANPAAAVPITEALDPPVRPPLGEPSLSELPTQEAEPEEVQRQADAAKLARDLAEQAKARARAEQDARAQEEARRLAEAAALARQLAEQAKADQAAKQAAAAQAAAEKASTAAEQAAKASPKRGKSRSRSLMERGRRPTSAKEALARAAENQAADPQKRSPSEQAQDLFVSTVPAGKVLLWVEARDRDRLRDLWTKHLERGRQRADLALVVAAEQVLRALDDVPAGHLWMGDAVVKRLSWALFVDTSSKRFVAALSPAASYLSEGLARPSSSDSVKA